MSLILVELCELENRDCVCKTAIKWCRTSADVGLRYYSFMVEKVIFMNPIYCNASVAIIM